ncbi:MAG: hypothetical protein LGR52_02830 [Candidatus Thiosymbion ectosymbiont of Robbea hypermnestra]|nr:hypothetical protein [Candidatus Thiosymbion ectosymbiont of Robbea hypermnestra]
MKNEKYEFFYEYARASLDDELNRSSRIEEKTGKFINLLSIIVAAYSLLLRYLVPDIFPLQGVFRWSIVVAIAITYLGLLLSWGFLYKALKFVEMPRMPLDDKFITMFKNRTLPTNHYTLGITASQALKDARKANSDKLELVRMGYRGMAFSVLCLSVSLLLFLIHQGIQ